MRGIALPAVALALGACASGHGRERGARTNAPDVPRVASNVLRGDYAGSAACADCHARIAQAWRASPMHTMTRRAEDAPIRAHFDGATFAFQGDSVTVLERDGARFMELRTRASGTQLFRVTRVVGGRTREDFVGAEVTGAANPATERPHGPEVILPVTWVFSTESWRYKGYSVMVMERPALRAGPVWRAKCIFCHNTVPYLETIFDDLEGGGAETYQGRVSDRFYPPERRWTFRPMDAEGLARAVADEIGFLGGTRPDPAAVSLREVLTEAIRTTRRRFDAEHFVEIGIGCEACHGGSRAHVEDPSIRPAVDARSPLFRMGPRSGEAPTHAQSVNHVCARCHTVLFSGYPYTWEGGMRTEGRSGGSHINSGEARDFLLGACSTELACTACHDPHRLDARERLDGFGTVAGNAVCTRCHDRFRTPQALAVHTHHRPDGAGSVCLDCHMPRKNMGLDYRLTRYHRIGSPSDPVRVEHDRPLECALCHVDRSVGDLVGAMERFWGRRYDRAALRDLYGDDLGVSPLRATLERGKPHEQAVAIAVLGEHRVGDAIPALVPHLAHAYPLIRYFTKHAIEATTGRPLDVDLNAEPAVIAAQAQRSLAPPLAPGP